MVRLADADYHGRPRSAFRRGGVSRSLEVWIDVDTLPASTHRAHLQGFAHHPDIDVYVTDETPGAIHVELQTDETRNAVGARIEHADGHTLIAGGPLDTYRALAASWQAEPQDDVSDSQLLFSALLGSVADNHPADAFVTGARALWSGMKQANAMSVTDALALVGLFLRSRDDFVVSFEPRPLTYNRGLFYWLLARELIPSWGPAWRALDPPRPDGSSWAFNGLGHALIIRVDQVLRARDRVHAELNLLQDNDTSDETLFALDGLLVAADACFDVIARVLNRHWALGTDAGARWRSDSWVQKLLRADHKLEVAVGDGTPLSDAVALVGALRLSLHAMPLNTIAHARGSMRDVENLLVVPPEQQTVIEEIFDSRGGDAAWGSDVRLDALVLLDVRRFVEALTRFSLQTIEGTMAAIVGSATQRDRVGDWEDTTEVRRHLRALSGTIGWNE